MKCEIEFLAVGEGSRAGDAIVVRHGEPHAFQVMLIDGGTEATGDTIVKHLRRQFGDQVFINDMVLTHSDIDHASGLRIVLEQMRVDRLWLHLPWIHAEQARKWGLFKNKGLTEDGLSRSIRSEYSIVRELVDLASRKRCLIQTPFQGQKIGPFIVLSPHFNHYSYLLPQFDKTPDPDEEAIRAAGMWIGKASPLSRIYEALQKRTDNWVNETWENERLRDGGVTSASNESSLVLYANLDAQNKILLTGDAGVRSLEWSIIFAREQMLPLQQFSFVQIPHHGSRRNVGPSVLNALIGPKQAGRTDHFTAFVSAPKDDSDHPRKIVLNAFMRRGARVVATQGTSKVHWGGFPVREGYTNAAHAYFSSVVEGYD
jgi:beta-lactamase superfamily II metal-dependent hydrolase